MKSKNLSRLAIIFISHTLLCIALLTNQKLNAQAQKPLPQLPPVSSVNTFPPPNKFVSAKLTYKIVDAANKTFGYDIYADSRLVIHQPSIPGLPGNNGFKTGADAAKVAFLVKEKMKKGEMPPSVTAEEMKKLKVIK